MVNVSEYLDIFLTVRENLARSYKFVFTKDIFLSKLDFSIQNLKYFSL